MTARTWRKLVMVPCLAAGAASGCSFGPSLATVEPANSPHGITVSIDTWAGSRIKGELLAVSDTGLFMIVQERIAFVFAEAIQRVQPGSGAASFLVNDPDLRNNPSARRLIPLSRYPAGLAPDVLQQFLRTSMQQFPELVRART